MWSTKEKVIGEMSEGKIVVYSELLNKNKKVDTEILKQMIKSGLTVLTNLSTEERHSVYSVMSYRSGLKFKKLKNKEIEISLIEPETESESESDTETDTEIEYTNISSEQELPIPKFKFESEQINIYHRMEDKYDSMTYLVMASIFVNTLFYMLIVVSDPVRTINFK